MPLICDDGAGSLNNPNNTNNTTLQPYVAPDLCVGSWEITDSNPDLCARNEQKNQQAYVAETLNISGAPINVYTLKGVHQQGNGSVLNKGRIITSHSYPGYPPTGINDVTPWRSLSSGINVTTSYTYLGVDFGIKLLSNTNGTEYEPHKQKWTDVGAISITQSNISGYFAQQVKVEIADGLVIVGIPNFTGTGNGFLTISGTGSDVTQGIVTLVALTSTTFNCYATLPDNTVIGLGAVIVGIPFNSTFLNFTVNYGIVPFSGGDMFSIPIEYEWKRVALFNLLQSPSPQILNLKSTYKVKAIRITPTLFNGANNWEILQLDVLDSPPTDINNIQDLFFNENRDRDYNTAPILIKAQYSPADSITDLSKFGLSILDQYTFTVSFANMVKLLGRPVVIGDIIEVIPEMQWDQNLQPIRKFLEVTDSGWSSGGFGPQYNPTVYRFNAQIALPSQETRDIFGTLDTQKYMTPDAILMDGIGEQLNTWPLTNSEEIIKASSDAVPEIGSDDIRSIKGIPERPLPLAANEVGQPPQGSGTSFNSPNLYIEAGLPPNGESYGEGFALPDMSGLTDGEYYRLNYPPETKIPARLFRFSAIKHRWIFLETDRRGEYSSAKPSIRNILQSNTNQSLGKKVT